MSIIEHYRPPSDADALRAAGPALPRPSTPPADVDFFTTLPFQSALGVYTAEVSSKTRHADGTPHRYPLAFRWGVLAASRPARFSVLSCGCEGWRRHLACRHAVHLTALLSIPLVAGCLLASDGCEVRGAYRQAGCRACGGDAYTVRLSFQLGRPDVDFLACADCRRAVVR